jgi:hypothetical protein
MAIVHSYRKAHIGAWKLSRTKHTTILMSSQAKDQGIQLTFDTSSLSEARIYSCEGSPEHPAYSITTDDAGGRTVLCHGAPGGEPIGTVVHRRHGGDHVILGAQSIPIDKWLVVTKNDQNNGVSLIIDGQEYIWSVQMEGTGRSKYFAYVVSILLHTVTGKVETLIDMRTVQKRRHHCR